MSWLVDRASYGRLKPVMTAISAHPERDGERHPARMKVIDDSGRVTDPPFAEPFEGMARQQLLKLYLRDGSVYLTRRDVLMEQGSLKGKDCRAWILLEERAWNIDSPFDLFVVEQMMKWGQRATHA